jgi:predicted Kef-type K+ transport protein
VQLAVGLGQVGEFSYVLGALALSGGLITKQVSAGLVGAVVVSIAASSLLVRVAHRSGPQALRTTPAVSGEANTLET